MSVDSTSALLFSPRPHDEVQQVGHSYHWHDGFRHRRSCWSGLWLAESYDWCPCDGVQHRQPPPNARDTADAVLFSACTVGRAAVSTMVRFLKTGAPPPHRRDDGGGGAGGATGCVQATTTRPQMTHQKTKKTPHVRCGLGCCPTWQIGCGGQTLDGVGIDCDGGGGGVVVVVRYESQISSSYCSSSRPRLSHRVGRLSANCPLRPLWPPAQASCSSRPLFRFVSAALPSPSPLTLGEDDGTPPVPRRVAGPGPPHVEHQLRLPLHLTLKRRQKH